MKTGVFVGGRWNQTFFKLLSSQAEQPYAQLNLSVDTSMATETDYAGHGPIPLSALKTPKSGGFSQLLLGTPGNVSFSDLDNIKVEELLVATGGGVMDFCGFGLEAGCHRS